MKGAVFSISLILSLNLLAAPSTQANESVKHSSKEFSGLADYYHHKLYGNKTASGEVLAKDKMTAAHRSLPFGTRVRVTNKRNGHSCVVVINDRGPFTPGKVIDLSHAAAAKIGALNAGTVAVICSVIEETEEED